MWTNILNGFLFMLLGSSTPDQASAAWSVTDWQGPASVLLERCIATYRTQDALGQKNFRVVSVVPVNSPFSYSDVVNGVTNHLRLLYGRESVTNITRLDEPYGFMAGTNPASWYRMDNYHVAPLLWDTDFFSSAVLTSTPARVIGVWREKGKYPFAIHTSNVSTSYVVRAFYEYDPLFQRPNAITPFMRRADGVMMDDLFSRCVTNYFDNTLSVNNSYDDYFRGSQVVTQMNVGAHWLAGAAVVIATNYVTTESASEFGTYYRTDTQTVAGFSAQYDYFTETESAASEVTLKDAYDYVTIASVPRYIYHVASFAYDDLPEWYPYAFSEWETNIVELPTGRYDSSGPVERITSEPQSTTYKTNIIGAAITGAGPFGIDFYFSEIAGTPEDYDERVVVGTNAVTAGDSFDWAVTNYFTAWIWKNVGDVLAAAMPPVHTARVDGLNRYVYSMGWDTTLSNGEWRLWQGPEAGRIAATNYFAFEYQYIKQITNENAQAWHYPKNFSSRWLPDYQTNIIEKIWRTKTESMRILVGYDDVAHYWKRNVRRDYFQYRYVPIYQVPVYSLRVTLPVWSRQTIPKYESVKDFLAKHNQVMPAGTIKGRADIYSGLRHLDGSNAIEIITRTRTLSTNDWTASAWISQPVSTSTAPVGVAGQYEASISGRFVFRKKTIQIRRKLNWPIDGAIDVYLRFKGNCDFDGLGRAQYLTQRVPELCLASGQSESEIFGEIDCAPVVNDVSYPAKYPANVELSWTGGDMIVVFRPDFVR